MCYIYSLTRNTEKNGFNDKEGELSNSVIGNPIFFQVFSPFIAVCICPFFLSAQHKPNSIFTFSHNYANF